LRRTRADLLLFGVTCVEFAILIVQTPAFTITDWIYVLQHLIVLGIALTRRAPQAQDHSWLTSAAVAVAYGYPYAQVIYLNWFAGVEAWPAAGFVMVTAAAVLSLASLLSLGRRFGVRPALRGLVTNGPYAVVRHPMYLSYVIGDIGYNLQEWNYATVAIVLAGWVSLIYRISAEERVLAKDPAWKGYAASVRYRVIPGLW
jgi:protein-S-isoprenylcysteine O-methyltransferase Ste14